MASAELARECAQDEKGHCATSREAERLSRATTELGSAISMAPRPLPRSRLLRGVTRSSTGSSARGADTPVARCSRHHLHGGCQPQRLERNRCCGKGNDRDAHEHPHSSERNLIGHGPEQSTCEGQLHSLPDPPADQQV